MTVLQNQLIDFSLDRIKEQLLDLLQDANSRVQQALLTIVNMHILNAGAMMKPFAESIQFFTLLVTLLESPAPVVRGKAVLTMLLLVKVNARSLILMSETKFFSALDKL